MRAAARRWTHASPSSAGEQPVVEFLGRTTFFTELAPQGHATHALAPGDYASRVSAGAGVLAEDAHTELTVVEPGQRHPGARRRSRTLFDPPARGWYSADLHHHADQAEAVTPPADLARSQLAAGLDLLFVSDHDSTANHAALQQIAERARRRLHSRDRTVAFLGPLQRLSARAGRQARHRYQHRQYRPDPSPRRGARAPAWCR